MPDSLMDSSARSRGECVGQKVQAAGDGLRGVIGKKGIGLNVDDENVMCLVTRKVEDKA